MNSSQPAGVPAGFSRDELATVGYVGWLTWAQLRATELADVPRAAGCYVVTRPNQRAPAYLAANPGGRFKGKDPTVPVARLAAEWVPGAHVVYIGKADDLRTRLRAYARFGAGEPVAHWGGRLIWQLADADQLLVAWHALAGASTARDLERLLLERFGELHHGRRPLANLTG